MRFRQVHLDFHTSPAIREIGSKFDKKKWQEVLRAGHVDSITCFSKCHHGWSYHPTKVGRMHPHLGFDLLKAQYDACKEIDINVPVYLSAGVDNCITMEHSEWREINKDGRLAGWSSSPIAPGFHTMCFNSPYLDYLCAQIEEAVRLFPGCDGIFLDIISQSQCVCNWCLDLMKKEGLDALKEEDRKKCSQMALEKYYKRTTAAAKVDNPEMPIFHNSGHISRGHRDILKYFSHLELESLPTGGWGYDHFPISAKYCKQLDHDFLGMTGKFHTTWGEFGGYKHPNALRYECAAMIAYGSKCSVGDQLHPNAEIDASTYGIIGAAYKEVEEKEQWCDNAETIADIGLLSVQAVNNTSRNDDADIGAGRILLEKGYLFDVIDGEMDFSKYKLIILPDQIKPAGKLKDKLDAYLSAGGKLFLTGESGLNQDNTGFVFDVGAEYSGTTEFCPDYVVPRDDLAPSFVKSPVVMYMKSQRIKAAGGESLGKVNDPYFNRDFRHFCSHQHTPNDPARAEYDCGVINGNILYLAHPVFTIYRGLGAVAYKDYVANCIDLLLGEGKSCVTNMPSTARVSLMEQKSENRYVLHLLYANTINRGGELDASGGNVSTSLRSVEVIEELLPLHNVTVSLKTEHKVKRVTLEPEGKDLPFTAKDGKIEFGIDSFICHRMIALHY
ncbi:MAG: beta-galactosidase trimerization domain-containing protein [Planctomycetes bacterium]|nr:beta-galactosidase trimerization domain-containing protein [Planctomycetota bacterium]